MFHVPLLPLGECIKRVFTKIAIVRNQERITARMDTQTKLGFKIIATMHIICQYNTLLLKKMYCHSLGYWME